MFYARDTYLLRTSHPLVVVRADWRPAILSATERHSAYAEDGGGLFLPETRVLAEPLKLQSTADILIRRL